MASAFSSVAVTLTLSSSYSYTLLVSSLSTVMTATASSTLSMFTIDLILISSSSDTTYATKLSSSRSSTVNWSLSLPSPLIPSEASLPLTVAAASLSTKNLNDALSDNSSVLNLTVMESNPSPLIASISSPFVDVRVLVVRTFSAGMLSTTIVGYPSSLYV